MKSYSLLFLWGMLAFSSASFAQRQEPVQEQKEQEQIDVFTVVEDPPSFPGGQDKMMEFIGKKLKYPKKARKKGIQGRVVISFVIDEQGKVTDTKVVKGIGHGCDEEALRVVKKMPRWKPGSQSGQNVKVRYVLPIRFVLGEPE